MVVVCGDHPAVPALNAARAERPVVVIGSGAVGEDERTAALPRRAQAELDLVDALAFDVIGVAIDSDRGRRVQVGGALFGLNPDLRDLCARRVVGWDGEL